MRPVIVEFFRNDVDRLWPEKAIRHRAGRGPRPTRRDQVVDQMRGKYGDSAAGMTILRTMKEKELVAEFHCSFVGGAGEAQQIDVHQHGVTNISP